MGRRAVYFHKKSAAAWLVDVNEIQTEHDTKSVIMKTTSVRRCTYEQCKVELAYLRLVEIPCHRSPKIKCVGGKRDKVNIIRNGLIAGFLEVYCSAENPAGAHLSRRGLLGAAEGAPPRRKAPEPRPAHILFYKMPPAC